MDIADMLGVPPEAYTRDPLSLVPALQNYVSRLPFEEFETSDWVTLHGDLLAYLADYLIRRHGARWCVVGDPATPRGYRYVIEALGRDGELRRVDPGDVIQNEFKSLPVEVTRMLASAELTLRLSSRIVDAE
jgi:hypothetical protein